MRMLENEGFAAEGYVDIFDGGPTMTARTDTVKSIAGAKQATVSSIDLDEGERALIAAGKLDSFKSAYGKRAFGDDGTVAIDATCAAALEVGVGDTVWSVAR